MFDYLWYFPCQNNNFWPQTVVDGSNVRLWNLQNVLQSIYHLISSQSLNLGGRRGTTDDVATIPFHPSLSSAALRESPNPIPFHSLMLTSHHFFCLSLLLAPFTVPCRNVFAMSENLEMWPYLLSFPFFTMVRRSSCTPISFWILLRTSSFFVGNVQKSPIASHHKGSFSRLLLSRSSSRRHKGR